MFSAPSRPPASSSPSSAHWIFGTCFSGATGVSFGGPAATTFTIDSATQITFAGWNTVADGLGTGYADMATYPFSATITLYAQWSN